jgi:hypothetical protein
LNGKQAEVGFSSSNNSSWQGISSEIFLVELFQEKKFSPADCSLVIPFQTFGMFHVPKNDCVVLCKISVLP